MPLPRSLFALLMVIWCLFLALQVGHPDDETEHAHVAWLMAVQHERPIHDFFQHHQPLLWDLLQFYYLAGGEGSAVLYFGRALVVLSALLASLGIVGIARLVAPKGQTSGVLGLLPLIALSVTFPALFVIRPETPGLALFILASWCWMSARQRAAGWREFLSGTLFGAAVIASPRFLPLAPAFLLLSREPERILFRRPGPLLVLAAGGATFIGVYLGLRGISLADVRFNIEFSSTLVSVGHPAGTYLDHAWRGFVIAALCTILSIGPASRLTGIARRRLLVHALFGLLILVVSIVSNRRYLYPQSLSAWLGWLCVMLAVAEGELAALAAPPRGRLLPASVVALSAICLLLLGVALSMDSTIVSQVRYKRALAATLRPGDKVLLGAGAHPIDAMDASYYVMPLTDCEDRLPETVRRLQPRWPVLPNCDLIEDIRRQQPVLIDDALFRGMSPADQAELRRIVDEAYDAEEAADYGLSGLHRLYRRKATRQ